MKESSPSHEPALYLVPYFDEDFDLRVMTALRERGYEVHCARDEGMNDATLARKVTDAEQLAFAVHHGWTLVSFNRGDFARLHTEYISRGWEHAGIVLSLQVGTGRVLRGLANLLDRVSADEVRNQLLYLQTFE